MVASKSARAGARADRIKHQVASVRATARVRVRVR